jgi:single-strand DNA-binding protein
MNLNKVFILGRLTADPMLRTTPTGKTVANFSVATNRIWNSNDGQKQQAVEYHDIVVWDRQADVVSRFLNKGSLVLIEGRLQTRSWDDPQGQKRRKTEIVADRIQLGPRSANVNSVNASNFSTPQPIRPIESPSLGGVEIPTIEIDEPTTPSPSDSEAENEIKPEDLPF